MKFILVVDAGTTAFKAVIFDQNLKIIASASNEFRIINPAPNEYELDSDDYWITCTAAIKNAVEKSSVDTGKICCIAVTSHTDTLFVLDEKGIPVNNGILWMDVRSQVQAERIQKHFGIERLFCMTGQTGASPIHFGSRLAWFIENKSELLNKVRHFLQTQDYLIYKLTGNPIIDHSIASCSLLSGLQEAQYWPEMLNFIGIERDKLSKIVLPGGFAGNLTPNAAQVTGLPAGIPIFPAAMDATSNALALGNVKTGLITEITGAALVISATCDSPVFDKLARVPCFVHAIPSKYLLMPWCETGGSALKWYRDQFFKFGQPTETEQQSLYDVITSEASEVPAGSDGVIILPNFAGSGSPDFNSRAKALIYGLTISHQRKHISRALLESIAFMLKRNLDVLTSMNVDFDCIYSAGGGSKSALWCQIKANVTGVPVIQLNEVETTAKGAAMIALNALGYRPLDTYSFDYNAKTTFTPDPKQHLRYKKAYELFNKLYDVLNKNFWNEDN